MIKTAILSVSDKTGITDLAAALQSAGYTILATGNTAKILTENSIKCSEVSEFTGFPEIFSGRVKTLQPRIFGGILMRRDDDSDKIQAAENNINPIDVVCVNLYPFPNIVENPDISHSEKIENIDIGGPSLIRAAAKNYKYVSVLTNKNQYDDFAAELKSGEISISTREKLAAEAFAHTADYDRVIADYFEEQFSGVKSLRISAQIKNELRYGENPHQKAFLYGNFYDYFEILHGKELSFNNIIDLSSAADIVGDLKRDSCVIVKHTNPCGSAEGDSVFDSYEKALSCDPVSAFGGIVAFGGAVDAETARKLNEIFLEIVLADDFTDEALAILKKKKNRRLLRLKKPIQDKELLLKNIPGGFAAQERDNSSIDDIELRVVTKRAPSESETDDLKFAWKICKHVKSNAVILVKEKKGIGIGAGQMSRIDSSKIAVMKAREQGFDLTGAVAASDAFFPFPDGVETLAEHGITAIIQPGGSIRDESVIEAADRLNLAMLFTGIRNFKH